MKKKLEIKDGISLPPQVLLLQLGAPTLGLRKRTPQIHLLFVGYRTCNPIKTVSRLSPALGQFKEVFAQMYGLLPD